MWQIGELAKEVHEQCSNATYSHRINHPGTEGRLQRHLADLNMSRSHVSRGPDHA